MGLLENDDERVVAFILKRLFPMKKILCIRPRATRLVLFMKRFRYYPEVNKVQGDHMYSSPKLLFCSRSI